VECLHKYKNGVGGDMDGFDSHLFGFENKKGGAAGGKKNSVKRNPQHPFPEIWGPTYGDLQNKSRRILGRR